MKFFQIFETFENYNPIIKFKNIEDKFCFEIVYHRRDYNCKINDLGMPITPRYSSSSW